MNHAFSLSAHQSTTDELWSVNITLNSGGETNGGSMNCLCCEGDGVLFDYIACGICGQYHQADFKGDCRDDVNRLPTDNCPRCDGTGYDPGGDNERDDSQTIHIR